MEKIYRFYVEKRPGFDVEASGLYHTLKEYLHVGGLKALRLFNRYDLTGIAEESAKKAGQLILSEPQCDALYAETMPKIDGEHSIFAVESLPGQYDQRADSAAQCIQVIAQGERPLVKAAKVYVLEDRKSTRLNSSHSGESRMPSSA